MSEGQRGFTLVELLIAITLLVLITAMLFSGLDLASRHYQGQTHRLERAARIALAQNFLRAQLADARALPNPLAAAGGIIFTGQPDQVRFVSKGPDSVNVGGLAELAIGYQADASGAKGALVAHWQPLEAAGSTEARDSVLLRGVERLEFSYFGAATPQEAPSWHTDWRSTTDLPSLVRLDLQFADGTSMPELVIAVDTSQAGGVQRASAQ